ncbi:Cloroperoxidase [Viridothelium virens]|uniref:Cloroperoxidase n=1 Tax=Viridothelium virens TaxID=1048519 RepID=A0A6A6HBJ4_VIRVR|nr:Cloroperoxidase [Viridothelium virens]
MRFSLLISPALPLLSLAHPSQMPRDTSSIPPYRGPAHNAVDSPCPIVNAFRNHGMIHSNGSFITKQAVMDAMGKLGIDSQLQNLLASGAVMAGQYARENDKATIPWDNTPGFTKEGEWFNLNDLDFHDFVEHDASMSREDAALGNHVEFSPKVWSQVLDVFEGKEKTSIDLIAKAMNVRYQDSKARNKDFKDEYRLKTAILRYGEQAMWTQVLAKDVESGEVSVADMKLLFEKERFPDNFTAHPPNSITGTTVNTMVPELFWANPGKGDEIRQIGIGNAMGFKDLLHNVNLKDFWHPHQLKEKVLGLYDEKKDGNVPIGDIPATDNDTR